MSEKKTRLSVTLTKPLLDSLVRLVKKGLYLNQGEAMRAGMRLLFKFHELEILTEEEAEVRKLEEEAEVPEVEEPEAEEEAPKE